MEMTPSAFATELMRMMAAKMGQRYFIIKLKMRLRRKTYTFSVTSSSIFSTPMTRDTQQAGGDGCNGHHDGVGEEIEEVEELHRRP